MISFFFPLWTFHLYHSVDIVFLWFPWKRVAANVEATESRVTSC